MKVSIVTTNEERYLFIKKALAQFGIETEKKPLTLDEIQADSVNEIAVKKALTAAKELGEPCICEDTELTISALNGFPGPYMKFAQAKLSIEKIFSLMKDETNRSAIFKSVLVYADQNGFSKTFDTILNGKICNTPIGKNGKGWDSIFMIESTGKTLAEYLKEDRFALWNKGYLELGKWLSERK